MSISRRNFHRGAGKSVGASLVLPVVPKLVQGASVPVEAPVTETRTLLHWRDCNMVGFEWTQTYRLSCTGEVYRLVGEQIVTGDGDCQMIRERANLVSGQQIYEALAELIQEDNPADDAFDHYVVEEVAQQLEWFGHDLVREFVTGYGEWITGAPIDRGEMVEEGYDEIVALLDKYS